MHKELNALIGELEVRRLAAYDYIKGNALTQLEMSRIYGETEEIEKVKRDLYDICWGERTIAEIKEKYTERIRYNKDYIKSHIETKLSVARLRGLIEIDKIVCKKLKEIENAK